MGTVGPREEINFPMGASPCLGDCAGPPAPSAPSSCRARAALAGQQRWDRPPSLGGFGSSLNTALPKWGGSEPPEGAGAALQCILKGAEPVMPPPRGAGHPLPNGLLSTVGTEAPPPEAGSAPGHSSPQPLVLRRISSASHVGGDISAGRAALPGDCAGSWPSPPGRGRGGKLALEAPREREAASLQEGSCGEARPGCAPKFRGDCRLTSCGFLSVFLDSAPVSNDAFPPLGVNTSSLAVYFPSV